MTQPDNSRHDGLSGIWHTLAERWLGQIKDRPRTAAFTGLLLCVLLVLVLRLTLRPKPAAAGMTNRLPPQADAGQLAEAVPAEDPLDERVPALPPIQLHESAGLPLPRNIFALDLRHFPGISASAAAGRVQVDQADEMNTAELHLAELKRQAAAFRLEGTVTGPSSVAFIDGTNVREGDEYRGFRVTRILSHGVQLEKDGVRLELRMPEY